MTRKETLKNKIVMIGSGKSAPFYSLTEKMPKVYTMRSVIKANNKKTIEFPENYFSVSPVISVEAELSGAPIYVQMNSTTKNSTIIVNSAPTDLYFHLIAISI